MSFAFINLYGKQHNPFIFMHSSGALFSPPLFSITFRLRTYHVLIFCVHLIEGGRVGSLGGTAKGLHCRYSLYYLATFVKRQTVPPRSWFKESLAPRRCAAWRPQTKACHGRPA